MWREMINEVWRHMIIYYLRVEDTEMNRQSCGISERCLCVCGGSCVWKEEVVWCTKGKNMECG